MGCSSSNLNGSTQEETLRNKEIEKQLANDKAALKVSIVVNF